MSTIETEPPSATDESAAIEERHEIVDRQRGATAKAVVDGAFEQAGQG